MLFISLLSLSLSLSPYSSYLEYRQTNILATSRLTTSRIPPNTHRDVDLSSRGRGQVGWWWADHKAGPILIRSAFSLDSPFHRYPRVLSMPLYPLTSSRLGLAWMVPPRLLLWVVTTPRMM